MINITNYILHRRQTLSKPVNLKLLQVGTYNILSPLNQLLKRFAKEDSINGRIFRIIGNMCQHRDQWGNIILDRKPQIVNHVVDFIKKVSKDEIPEDENISEATVMMAIRALRYVLPLEKKMES